MRVIAACICASCKPVTTVREELHDGVAELIIRLIDADKAATLLHRAQSGCAYDTGAYTAPDNVWYLRDIDYSNETIRPFPAK
jgi:hypothetical protein